tara:strand:+ start:4445 stop:5443 length:999 start_codon:yes stop_codon:yes gene_type:complete
MAAIAKRGPYQWQAKVRRRGYPVQSKTFDTKREAEAWASVIESEMARGIFVDRSAGERTSLEEVIERYIKETAPMHKGADAEVSRLNRFIREEDDLTVRRMATLRTEDFERYRDKRLETVSPSTVKRELNLLHAVIEGERKKLGLVENPISDVKRPRVRDQRDVRLQDGEEEKLLAALDQARNPWIKPATILALETAMRRSELLSMKWEDVDLKTKVVRLHDTKNGDAREVPLSPRAIKVLKELPRNIGGAILGTSAEGLKNAFERTRKRAGMEHFNFHDLRHEATSRLFERGWNVMEVAAVTGHKDLQSLKRYTNLRASDLADKLARQPLL